MARIDTFTNWATDVADSIRTKTGKTDKIPASEFDTEIINIQTKEDLDTELTVQNEEITEQEDLLNDAYAALLNKVFGSINGSTLNVFVQDEEPAGKNGVWIQRSYGTPKIVEKFLSSKINLVGTATYDQGVGPNASLDGILYVFGGRDSSSNSTTVNSYKYDPETNTTTQIVSIKDYMNMGIAVGIGTNIFLFGGHTGAAMDYKTYKYDTISNTLTKMTNSPVRFTYGHALATENYIYLVGVNENSTSGTKASKSIYRYNISGNSYTTISVPFYSSDNCAAIVGDEIYVLGSYDTTGTLSAGKYSNKSYKYNITTKVTTELADIPHILRGETVVIEDNIYCFDNYGNDAVMYNIPTNTFKVIKGFSDPLNRNDVHISPVNNKVYYYGGISTSYGATIMSVDIPALEDEIEYDDDTLIIVRDENGSLFQTKLVAFSDMIFGFDYIKYYDKNTDTYDETSPIYYGDGTQWVKIKN